MSAGTRPDVSILIPLHNAARWIAECLGRLAAAAEGIAYEAIVVDNASSDDTLSLCPDIPGMRILRNNANVGFSKAVNRAASEARSDVLVVANQDLYLKPGALRTLAQFVSSKRAVAGGKLASRDGRFQPSCGPFPTLGGTLARLVFPRSGRKYYIRGLPNDCPTEVDWITGAFMAFPRAVFDAVGGFDENFFMYYEDVDFCLRAKKKGFPAYYVPSAEAVHAAPYAERSQAPDWLRREVRISQMRYFDKHRPRWEATVIRALNRAYFSACGWGWPPSSKSAAAA